MRPVRLCTMRPGGVGVDFSRDGRILAASDSGRKTLCMDAATGKVLHVFGSPSRLRHRVTLSPSGDRAATSEFDATRQRSPVMIWDVAGGGKPLTLLGHRDPVLEIVFSPDGGRLASTGRERTVILWDAVSGEELMTLRGHDTAVTTLAFSPDGQRLVTGEYEGMVRVWDTRAPNDGTAAAAGTGRPAPRVGGRAGTVCIWDARPRTGGRSLRMRHRPARHSTPSPSRPLISSCSVTAAGPIGSRSSG